MIAGNREKESVNESDWQPKIQPWYQRTVLVMRRKLL